MKKTTFAPKTEIVLNILEVKNLTKKYAQSKYFALTGVNLEVQKGEILAITGESGCGKTTLLRLIAGLEEPQDGEIVIYQEIVANKTTWVKPEKRKVGMVFQDYALFPHLNVEENIAFGLAKNVDKRQRISEILDLVGLQGYQKRYPHELSGGQQQRIALARALAPSPAVLLLDEPFSNLDEGIKDQVREELLQIIQQSQMTTLLVTHDSKDALTMADRIIVMSKGMVQQCGTPQQLYHQPNSEYVANFFGKVNVIPAQLLGLRQQELVGVRPEHIAIIQENKPEGALKGIIKKIYFFGAFQEVIVQIDKEQWLVRTTGEANLKIGTEIYLRVTLYFTLSPK